jgi:hypothetical protein
MVQGSVIGVSKRRCSVHEGGVETVDLGFCMVTPTAHETAKVTVKQLCMQDTVSILTVPCLTIVWKLISIKIPVSMVAAKQEYERKIK